jgi:hypothetical protein
MSLLVLEVGPPSMWSLRRRLRLLLWKSRLLRLLRLLRRRLLKSLLSP